MSHGALDELVHEEDQTGLMILVCATCLHVDSLLGDLFYIAQS